LSKSFTSTAIGLAVDEGLLDLNDKVAKFFPNDLPENPSENLMTMTIRDLLIMGTGNHNDTFDPIKKSKESNWAKIFLAQPVEHRPGEYFKYNTGATYMLSNILQKVTGKTLVEYLKPRLFEPLGIKNYSWETDPTGVNTGGYGLKIQTEAIANLGQLYLQKGVWKGKRLLSEQWISLATTKQIDNGTNHKSDWNQGYGFQFWMCRHKAYRGDGAFGQYCIVLPEKDAVIAINSGLGDMQKVLNLVWEILLPEMKDESLPENKKLNEHLKQRLANLHLAYANGNAQPTPNIIGTTYHFSENDKNFKTITIENNELKLENAHGLQMIPFSKNKWLEGKITFEKDIVQVVGQTNGLQKIASSGAWVTPHHLQVIMYMNETPFRLTFDFKFSENELTLDLNYNLSFDQKNHQLKATQFNKISPTK